MAEGEPVQRLWAGTEEVSKSADGVAALHIALRVDWTPPSRQVVWSGQ